MYFARCQAFSKIKSVYAEFTLPVVYTSKVNSVKIVVSVYIYCHCVITKRNFAAVKIKKELYHQKSFVGKKQKSPFNFRFFRLR